ncbi:unnamed protein product [Microthlaspi erraticum]|uniref:Cysteine-rich receptor-like protein kinase n=1 Tax=Microthlaspi erraticum TaxID=1685480 RepID=A0A6D2J806_9BRAS|nr:unnamed protein product [Microthlaspi erraticum]
MKQRSLSSLSILCFFLLNFGGSSVSAQTCIQNRKNFTPNGTYDDNRRLILSSLPSNTATQDGFYYGSLGQEPNRIYAAGMCIPRADANDCSACIKGASDWLIQDCTNQEDAYYWALDPTNCLVRYANVSFSGSAAFWETTPQYLVMYNAEINPNLTDFKKIWEGLIRGLISAASATKNTPSSSDNHYKAGVAALTPFQNMYGLMQCTPDISSGDCDNCLRQSVIDYQTCCAQKTGGYVMRPICFFRWQMFTFSKGFGNITLAPPPSPPSPSRPPPLRRQPPSAVDRAKTTENNSRKFSVGSIVALAVLVLLVLIIILGLLAWRYEVFCWRRKSSTEVELIQSESHREVELNQTGVTAVRIRKYSFETIRTATDSFSESNKLGRGGFGEVFKGVLPDGKEVAVKRLFRGSRQGERDFKNEVVVVAKLQHNNLVKILGFSVNGDEKIIVYEFVPNKSLDFFLFDPANQGQLDWTTRYNKIIRGILYLHQDSPLRIIHRDLKTDNILLEDDMNPKIADFGMARICGMDQTTMHTNRIAGTDGYMPPEYRSLGEISVKFDVYSFGVLVLEIICGRRDRSFNNLGLKLVIYAWRLWRDGTPLNLVDTTIRNNYPREEVTRCIHIALLCVQKEPTDRPDMWTVMSMLTSNTFSLPLPNPPGFFIPNTTPYQSTLRTDSHLINDGT